ncbi:protein terminal ear1 homolog [Benincasa hispida]|uniref:protein terminal ear1 homolog n=1 Tax=Benincasa hispida TaxID=102211 RepID=UPI0019014350|nr:protein terminal ear1 homolog [Benincasa hispida]
MGFSLNPNADPFLYTTPFVSPPKLHFIPIYKTPPKLILAPPLHAYVEVDPYLHHYSMYSDSELFYDVVPQVPSSWPCSDGFCGGGGGVVSHSQGEGYVAKNNKGERKYYCKVKEWVPQLHFRVPPESDNDTNFQLLPFQTTTLMIKNIPNQLRRNDLMNILDEHCKLKNASFEKNNDNRLDGRRRSEYDFVYLPMDFRKISNLGYAFVNFTNPTAASEFYKAFHRRQWNVAVNKKVCEIKRAKLQGLKALMDAFRNKIFWCHANNYLPVMLEPPSDGYRRYRATPVGKRISQPPPSPIKKCG